MRIQNLEQNNALLATEFLLRAKTNAVQQPHVSNIRFIIITLRLVSLVISLPKYKPICCHISKLLGITHTADKNMFSWRPVL